MPFSWVILESSTWTFFEEQERTDEREIEPPSAISGTVPLITEDWEKNDMREGRMKEGRGKGKSAGWKSSQPWCLVGLNLLEGICECGFCKDRNYWDEVRCPFQHATHRNPTACSDSTIVADFLRTLWHYQNSAEIMTSPPFRRLHDIIKTLPGMVSISTLHWQLHRWP